MQAGAHGAGLALAAVDGGVCRARCRRRAAVQRLCCRAAADGAAQTGSDSLAVSGLVPLDELCNDFICKSSPAVESTLRQVARDLDNVREGTARSQSPYAESVVFTDALLCRVAGKESWRAFAPIRTLLKKPRAAVTSMRMEGLDTAAIGWSLEGDTPVGSLCKSALTLNLITGRVLKQRDSWSFTSPTPPQAAAVYTVQRLLYNLAQSASGAAAAAAKATEPSNDSSQIYGDPTDPMKFFQKEDTTMADGVQLALVLAVLYAVVQALKLANGVQ